MILASSSPQRRAILEQLGVAFTVVAPGVKELESGTPEEVARENARRKALAVAGGPLTTGAAGASPGDAGAVAAGQRTGGDAETVLGVDTVVALDAAIYGKPTDREHAAATLRALSGREHRVLSGVCVVRGGSVEEAVASTTVRFAELGDAALEWYLDTGEWRGRAGGYAIQGRGAALVRSIDGDYLNVVGLPVTALLGLLPSLLFPAVF